MNKTPATLPALHQYDLKLCEYIASNIRQHFADTSFRMWMQEQVEPEELITFLTKETGAGGDSEMRLLSLDELQELADCVHAMHLGCPFDWTEYPPLHRKYIDCVPELKAMFTEAIADEWCRDSQKFARQLELPELNLVDGLEIAADWIRALRRYKNPGSATHSQPKYTEAELEKVKKVIAEYRKDGSGEDPVRKVILLKAGLATQKVSRILRDLQAAGEYDGFSRSLSTKHLNNG